MEQPLVEKRENTRSAWKKSTNGIWEQKPTGKDCLTVCPFCLKLPV